MARAEIASVERSYRRGTTETILLRPIALDGRLFTVPGDPSILADNPGGRGRFRAGGSSEYLYSS